MNDFNHKFPFQTKCGWPARLLGVVHRRAFPLVVAVQNPAFDAEEIHCYGFDGKQPMRAVYSSGEVADGHEGAKEGALSLVNIEEVPDLLIRQGSVVEASIVPLAPFPANSNPFRYDYSSMGTHLVRGWTVMHDGYVEDGPEGFGLTGFYLFNKYTGQRIGVRFSPATPEAIEHRLMANPIV